MRLTFCFFFFLFVFSLPLASVPHPLPLVDDNPHDMLRSAAGATSDNVGNHDTLCPHQHVLALDAGHRHAKPFTGVAHNGHGNELHTSSATTTSRGSGLFLAHGPWDSNQAMAAGWWAQMSKAARFKHVHTCVRACVCVCVLMCARSHAHAHPLPKVAHLAGWSSQCQARQAAAAAAAAASSVGTTPGPQVPVPATH